MPATLDQLTDMAAMRERLGLRLSPDGAFNHYYNDVAALLREVQRLQEEADLARACFIEDGVVAPDSASLYDYAVRWKNEATGFWEKAQTKKLRDELRDTRSHLIDSEAMVDQFTKLLEEARTEIDALKEQSDGQIDALFRQEADFNKLLQAEQAAQIDLHDKVAKLETALVDCSTRCEQVLAMAQAQHAAKVDEAREALDAAMQALAS
jgi:hypothetical protein